MDQKIDGMDLATSVDGCLRLLEMEGTDSEATQAVAWWTSYTLIETALRILSNASFQVSATPGLAQTNSEVCANLQDVGKDVLAMYRWYLRQVERNLKSTNSTYLEFLKTQRLQKSGGY